MGNTLMEGQFKEGAEWLPGSIKDKSPMQNDDIYTFVFYSLKNENVDFMCL